MSIKPTDFATQTGISIPYASQLLSGTRRPSLSLALEIFKATGRKMGPIANASDDDIKVLTRLQDAA